MGAVAPVDQLDAAQARLRTTIQEVKLCCRKGASVGIVQRAMAILIQRLETYVGHAFEREAGFEVMLSDLKALQGGAHLLPAESMAGHVIRLADELLKRLVHESHEAWSGAGAERHEFIGA